MFGIVERGDGGQRDNAVQIVGKTTAGKESRRLRRGHGVSDSQTGEPVNRGKAASDDHATVTGRSMNDAYSDEPPT